MEVNLVTFNKQEYLSTPDIDGNSFFAYIRKNDDLREAEAAITEIKRWAEEIGVRILPYVPVVNASRK